MSVTSVKSPFEGKFCTSPFEYCYIDRTGDLFLCCPGALPTVAGNLAESSFDEVWNSEIAQAVRQTIHDGSFSHCWVEHCPFKDTHIRLEPRDEISTPYGRELAETRRTALAHGPKEIVIAYDPTCNLTCPFCRRGQVVPGRDEKERTRRIHERLWNEGLKDCELLCIAGDGDPFASPFYREALQTFDATQFPQLKIYLVSNGLLFTPRNWESIRGAHPAIGRVNISINAASATTFAINQRGGKWETLLENLQFMKSLRQGGAIPFWSLSFIVQANNFREMPRFVELGTELGVDMISFVQLMPGPLSPEEFEREAIHRPTHPAHAEFLEVMANPSVPAANVIFNSLERFLPGARAHAAGGAPLETEDTAWLTSDDEIAWEEFSARIGLHPSQEEQVRALLNNLRDDYVNVLSAPAQGGKCTPMQFLSEALRKDGFEALPEVMRAFTAYADNTLHAEQNSSYLRVFRRYHGRANVELQALLNAEQQRAFALMSQVSLLQIRTGHDPLGAALQRLSDAVQVQGHHPGDPATDSSPEFLIQSLCLSGIQAERAGAILVQLRRTLAEILWEPSAGDGESPIELLARLQNESAEGAMTLFHAYVEETRNGDGTLYAELIRAEAARAQQEIAALLTDPGQLRQLEALAYLLPSLRLDRFDPVESAVMTERRNLERAIAQVP